MKITLTGQNDLALGPPGTGKTTYALAEVEKALAAGVDPSRIHFLTFTRRAAEEGAQRAVAKFGKQAALNFRTLHSLAYRLLGTRPGEILDHSDYAELGELLGLRFSRWFDAEEAAVGGQQEGDALRAVAEYAAATCQLPETVADAFGGVNRWKLQRYLSTLTDMKRNTGKSDFSDLLSQCIADGHRLDADLVVVDEAQDLSQLQWRLLAQLFSKAKRVLIVGDDDQAIFRWAGADVKTFLELEARRKTLKKTYRLPTQVHATAQFIAGRIRQRYDKDWSPVKREPGDVTVVGQPEAVDLHREGTYLLLARNGYLLSEWVTRCREEGLAYKRRQVRGANKEHLAAIRAHEAQRKGKAVTDEHAALVSKYRRGAAKAPWYESLTGIPLADAQYYRAALRRGANLDAEPLLQINTIHGVKGAEADHVVLLTDRSTRTDASALRSPDDEHRVFYVGVTRARQTLQVVAPQGLNAYQFSKT